MLRFVATLTLLLSLSTAIPEQSFYKPHRSAASDSQITFALENNYDDTGPGAKTREYAYKTYKHLEDVLIGYIEDKDTILPEAERSMAIKTLQKKYPSYNKHSLQRFEPKTVDEYIGYNTAIDAEKQAIINLNPVRENIRQYNNRVADLQAFLNPTEFRSVNTGPRYTSPSENIEESKREYSYSYKVNDAETGDQKAAHEHREGDTVRGYYSLLDADGSMRIVKYRADDDGFHAVVDRSE